MDIKGEAWRNFLDSMDFESDDKNFKYEFKIMTRKFGRAYIEYCKAAWMANDGVQSEEEFMKMNGDMPSKFFEKTIKGE